MNFPRQKKIEISASFLCALAALLVLLLGLRHPELSVHFKAIAATLFAGSLIAALALLQTRLAEQAQLERRDASASREDDQLFEEEDFLPKEKAYASFRKAVLPLLLGLIAILEVCTLFLWGEGLAENYKLSEDTANALLSGSAVFGIITLATFLSGKYLAGLAHGEKEHHLRPIAAYLILAAISSTAACGASLAASYGHVQWALYCARFVIILLVILAFEKMLLWVVDCYRPRRSNEADIPLHESRLLALFTRPRGLVGNLSDIVEYQFGLKVSDKALRHFFTKLILPWAAVQGLTLFLFSSLTYIPQGQSGLITSDSANMRALTPGLHFTKPWPFCQVRRFDLGRTYTLASDFGQEEITDEVEDDDHKEEDQTKAAPHPVKYLDQEAGELLLTRAEGNASSMVQVSASVNYRIVDPAAWYAFSAEPKKKLASMLRRQLLSLSAEYSFHKLMERGPDALEKDIHFRLFEKTEKMNSGIEIQSINIANLAAPAKAGSAYRDYLSALQEAKSLISSAEKTAAEQEAIAVKKAAIISLAGIAEFERKKQFSLAEQEIYDAQEHAFRTQPKLYRTLALMEVLEKKLRPARKIIFSTVIESLLRFDLKKVQPDITDIEVK